MLSVVIITGNQLRHQYYVSEMAKQLHVAGIVYEAKINQARPFARENGSISLAEQHFQARSSSERQYYADRISLPDSPCLEVPTGASNGETCFEWVKARQPDYLLLFGCSIIKDPLLSHYDGRVINMHLGLSPYYRGAGTNFWPLVNGEPECVGATIHLATAKVDAGAILRQVRANFVPGDGPHDIGNKTIMAAIAQIPAVVVGYDQGEIKPQPQDLSIGQVYRRRDLAESAIAKLYKNFQAGMLPTFLDQANERLAAYPIIA